MSDEVEDGTAAAPMPLISAREHWRAGPAIRRAKAWGGLAGFGLVALAGVLQGAAVPDLLWHSLVGGLVGRLVAWAAAVAVWRQLIPAETRHLVNEYVEARKAQLDEQREKAAAAKAAAQAASSETPD